MSPFLPPQAASLIQDSPVLSRLASITVLQPLYYLVQQTIHWLFMGYSMTAFCLFTWDKWMKVARDLPARGEGTAERSGGQWGGGQFQAIIYHGGCVSPQVYKSIYFLGHVFFLSLLFILPYVRKVMVPRKEKLKKME